MRSGIDDFSMHDNASLNAHVTKNNHQPTMRTTEQASWYLEEVIQELRTQQATKAIERTAKETELAGWRLEGVMQELREWHEREEREIAQLRWEMWVEASSDEDE